ncbi:hypothetical protein IWZ00DRAFT_517887 [Phyllosticta capitalensis]
MGKGRPDAPRCVTVMVTRLMLFVAYSVPQLRRYKRSHCPLFSLATVFCLLVPPRQLSWATPIHQRPRIFHLRNLSV